MPITEGHPDAHFLGTRRIRAFFSAITWEESGLPGKSSWQRQDREGEKDHAATAQ